MKNNVGRAAAESIMWRTKKPKHLEGLDMSSPGSGSPHNILMIMYRRKVYMTYQVKMTMVNMYINTA